ncbi:MAG: cation diffusion facilitator family transporter, partial [Candidatus Dadabacteria bacterium]
MSSSSREANKNKKFRTALLSISVSLVLIAVKVAVGILTNSVSILASAADSFLDVTASSVNFYSIRKSEKPADHDHKFGHGKAEGLAGLFQTFIIGSSALYLIYISALRLLKGEKLVSVGWGVLVIALSMV